MSNSNSVSNTNNGNFELKESYDDDDDVDNNSMPSLTSIPTSSFDSDNDDYSDAAVEEIKTNCGMIDEAEHAVYYSRQVLGINDAMPWNQLYH